MTGRVLQVGAADLHDILVGLRLVVQRLEQVLEGGNEPVMDLAGDRDVHGGGEQSFDDWPMFTWSFG